MCETYAPFQMLNTDPRYIPGWGAGNVWLFSYYINKSLKKKGSMWYPDIVQHARAKNRLNKPVDHHLRLRVPPESMSRWFTGLNEFLNEFGRV